MKRTSLWEIKERRRSLVRMTRERARRAGLVVGMEEVGRGTV